MLADMRRLTVLALLLTLLLGCGNDNGSDPVSVGAPSPTTSDDHAEVHASPSSSVAFSPAKVLIDTDEGSVLIDAEKAETTEQRSLGLMHRTSLPEDSGMVFLFFESHSGGFWMKNTLIPLSIAFFDERGKILRILDMEPCEADPCPIYDPGVAYSGALEVNQGSFDRWHVEEGDRITVTH